ncbi:unnamed protein product [Closterium sp. Naga37s-1]|nr:unnamed protein product [Closterium sp. Naga37s-1]
MSEVSAKTGEAVAKGKAEVQESMDKARHPTSKEARAIADAKEAQRKEHAELEKERKIAGAMEREAAEKEARHEKHGVMGAGYTTGHHGTTGAAQVGHSTEGTGLGGTTTGTGSETTGGTAGRRHVFQ